MEKDAPILPCPPILPTPPLLPRPPILPSPALLRNSPILPTPPILRSSPILRRKLDFVGLSMCFQNGVSNPFSVRIDKASEPKSFEAKVKRQDHGCRVKMPLFSHQSEGFSQRTEEVIQGILKVESPGLLAESPLRDIRRQKASINHSSFFAKRISTVERVNADIDGAISLLHQSLSSSNANQDFDVHLDREVEILDEGEKQASSNNLERSRTKNANLSKDGERSGCQMSSEVTQCNRLGRSNRVNGESMPLTSTIEKVDRDASESEELNVDIIDREEGHRHLPEEQLQVTADLQGSNIGLLSGGVGEEELGKNQDLDVHLDTKVEILDEGEKQASSNNLERSRTENVSFGNDGGERPRFPTSSEETQCNRLGRSNRRNGERMLLTSTIEKVDREASEIEELEVDMTDREEGQHHLPEEQLQLTADLQFSNIGSLSGGVGEEELEGCEIKGVSSAHVLPSARRIKIADGLMQFEPENTKPDLRSSKSKISKNIHLNIDVKENKCQEANTHRHTPDYDICLADCTEIVKNVSVKDAQRSFINFCKKLYAAIKILQELARHTDPPSPRVTSLAREVFSGIQAAYTVTNTRSGKKQDANKNFFPRLLELAYGSRKKLFTSSQVRELENMLQATGLQRTRNKLAVDKLEEKHCEFGESSPNTAVTTQLEIESSAATIDNPTVFDVDMKQISNTSLLTEEQLLCDQDTMSAGLCPVGSQHTHPCSILQVDANLDSPHISTRLPSMLASSMENLQKSELLGSDLEKGKTEANGQIMDTLLSAANMQGRSNRKQFVPSLQDSSDAITYHEKTAGKFIMAHTGLRCPAPSEKGEIAGGNKAGLEQSLCNPDNTDEKISLHDMTAAIKHGVAERHMTRSNLMLAKCQINIQDKCQINIQDPRRKPVNPPVQDGICKGECNELLHIIDNEPPGRTHNLEDGYRKHNVDLLVAEVTSPRKKFVLTENYGNLSLGCENPAVPVWRRDGWLKDNMLAHFAIEGSEDKAINKAMHVNMWNPSFNEHITGHVLPENDFSIKMCNKRQRVGMAQHELNNTSLVTIREESPFALNHQMNKIFQTSVSSSARPISPVELMARDSVKLRAKCRDLQQALLGSLLARNEYPCFDPPRVVGAALEAALPVKDGSLRLSQAVNNEQETGPFIAKDIKKSSIAASQEGFPSNHTQKASERKNETLNDVANILGSSQSTTYAQSMQLLVAQPRISTSFKDVSENMDVKCPSSIKSGAKDKVVRYTSSMPSAPTSLSMKDLNGSTGPAPLKQESCRCWENMEHLLKGLDAEQQCAVRQERVRRIQEQNSMFNARKLCLVLDLDHTLLNSAKFAEIGEEWEARLCANKAAECAKISKEGAGRRELYRFPHLGMWTKLRPGIWHFLDRACQLYELHVYTMGSKTYATEMAKLLDPTGALFAGRIISKGDEGDEKPPRSKDLDGVLGMESAVIIIDDSIRVWPHHRHNLIVVERYMYFPGSRCQFGLAGPSILEVGQDEREESGMLASALRVIGKIHFKFFSNRQLHEVDVREILAAQQSRVLSGCKVLFSRVFPQEESQPQLHPLWRMAEQFGATCSTSMDEKVTHVVAISLGTSKVNWALASGKFVVRPAWLEASAIYYQRANEKEFPVPPPLVFHSSGSSALSS